MGSTRLTKSVTKHIIASIQKDWCYNNPNDYDDTGDWCKRNSDFLVGVKQVVNSVTTSKLLVELWPESQKYIPEHKGKRVIDPSLLDFINQELGVEP